MRTKLSKTKNKIIHVAKSLFSEMSVYKATMNDIAQAANMSRRTLYMHFKSKEEIYHYVVEDHVKDINEKLQKAADSALPPDRKLKLYILARFNVIDNLVRQNKYIRYDFIFKSLEQPFIIIGHRKRNYQSLREYVDLLFNGILNKG